MKQVSGGSTGRSSEGLAQWGGVWEIASCVITGSPVCRLLLGVGLAVSTTWSTRAGAEPEREPALRSYSVPNGCPERADFIAAITAKLEGGRSAGAEEDVSFDVVVHGDVERAWGTLSIRLRDARTSHRPIPPAGCADVLSSMAVIAAMILDGSGIDAAPRDPWPVELPPAKTVPKASASPSTDSPLAARALSPAYPGPSEERRARWNARLGVGPQSGVAPGLVPRLYAGFGLEFERSGAFSPSLDVMASVAQSDQKVARYGEAQFRLVAVNANVCPIRWPASEPAWIFRGCLPVEVGELRGVGLNTLSARTQRMPWLGAGLGARAEWRLSRGFRIELEGRAIALGRADRFIFEPDEVIHRVPRFAVGLRIGAALLAP